MNIYSFDKKTLKRENNLYDIFEKNIQYSREVPLYKYIVPKEYEMRLDLVSKKLYGSSDYTEELGIINEIINPYSIKENQDIYYCKLEDMSSLYVQDDLKEDNEIRDKVIKAATKKGSEERFLPTTVKPKNIKQVTIDTKNRKIKIMNTFK